MTSWRKMRRSPEFKATMQKGRKKFCRSAVVFSRRHDREVGGAVGEAVRAAVAGSMVKDGAVGAEVEAAAAVEPKGVAGAEVGDGVVGETVEAAVGGSTAKAIQISFGVIASRKVGKAVSRNRCKRLVREAWRSFAAGSGVDYVNVKAAGRCSVAAGCGGGGGVEVGGYSDAVWQRRGEAGSAGDVVEFAPTTVGKTAVNYSGGDEQRRRDSAVVTAIKSGQQRQGKRGATVAEQGASDRGGSERVKGVASRPNLDLVFVARKEMVTMSYQEVKRELWHICKNIMERDG